MTWPAVVPDPTVSALPRSSGRGSVAIVWCAVVFGAVVFAALVGWLTSARRARGFSARGRLAVPFDGPPSAALAAGYCPGCAGTGQVERTVPAPGVYRCSTCGGGGTVAAMERWLNRDHYPPP